MFNLISPIVGMLSVDLGRDDLDIALEFGEESPHVVELTEVELIFLHLRREVG